MNRFLASIQTVRRTLRAGIRTSILFAFGLGIWSGISVIPHTDSSLAHESLVQYSMVAGDVAWAEDKKESAPQSNPIGEGVMTGVNSIYSILFSLITPFLMLAGWLLTPDWVFGEIFWLRTALHDLWVLISNVVYIAFAFLLIAMAFMNIYAGEKNTWAIKAKLPKLIVGVISVPFTWFFVSAILSISSILTASVIQLAGDLRVSSSTSTEITINIPKDCTIDFTASPTGTTWTWADTKSTFFSCKGKESKTLSEVLESDNAFGVVGYYAYEIFRIDDYKKIGTSNLPSIKSVSDLTVQLIIALLLFLAFALIIMALVFALFMRALYFWAIAIASPLLSLRYFFDGKLGGFGDKWLSIGSIVGLAMVPVYVAGALAFGLVFLSAVGNANLGEAGTTKSKYVQVKDLPSEGSVKVQKMTVLGTEYIVKGEPVGAGIAGSAGTLAGGFIGRLIINIIALGVLWFAVMAALKGSEVTKEAAEPIASFGAEIGKLAKKLPQYAPIIPTGHGKVWVGNLPEIAQGLSGLIRSAGSQNAQATGKSLAESMGFKIDPKVSDMQVVNTRFSSVNAWNLGSAVNDMVKANGVKNTQEFMNQPSARKDEYVKLINKLDKAVLDDAGKTALIKQINSRSQSDIAAAFKKLDELAHGHVGWSIAIVDTSTLDAFFAQQGGASATNASTGGQANSKEIQVDVGTQTKVTLPIDLDPNKITVADKDALKAWLNKAWNEGILKWQLTGQAWLNGSQAEELIKKIKN